MTNRAPDAFAQPHFSRDQLVSLGRPMLSLDASLLPEGLTDLRGAIETESEGVSGWLDRPIVVTIGRFAVPAQPTHDATTRADMLMFSQ